jgi:hypothetical protein
MTEPVASPATVGSSRVPDTITEGVGVVVRVRPLSTKERADPSVHNCIQALSDTVVIDANTHTRPASVDGKTVSYTAASAAASLPNAAGGTPASPSLRNPTRAYQFSVDHVFHTHASQIEVYEESCKHIVEGVFHGINGSILAYGATGSGKTHTMFGSTMSAAGIVYQAVQDIFAEKERLEEEEGKRVRIRCSFLEVYNEDVFDLLVKADTNNAGGAPSSSSSLSAGPRPGKRIPLPVRETAGSGDVDAYGGGGVGGGLYIPGLTHIFPETLDDFTRGIEHGHAQRFVAATGANAQSSRSHAIITVEVEVRGDPARVAEVAAVATTGGDDETASAGPAPSSNTNAVASDFTSPTTTTITTAVKSTRDSGTKAAKRKKQKQQPSSPTVTVATIQFCDLAGSERAASTSNTGLRLREGGNINRSLLALGAVVQSLAQQKVRKQQTGGKGGSKIFIPYRGSKLTRLLRDGIGGNCRTMMLFCVSPSTKHIEETVNTMKFAMNAREIQVVAHRNEFAVNSSHLAKTQETIIEELRAELARTRAALAQFTGDGVTTVSTEVQEVTSGHERQLSSFSIKSPVAANAQGGDGVNSGENSLCLSPTAASTAAAASVPPPPRPGTPSAVLPQRGTLTPSISAGGGHAKPTVSPLSASQVDVSAGSSVPRPSLSSRAARPSVFAENTRLFTDLEAKLKDFSAQKESLYHEVRDAEERERDGEAQLRDLQWRLATFLVSDAYGSRARGEVDLGSGGSSTVGVAGLRKTIASMEEAQAQQSSKLTELTNRLEEADRQFASTRKALLRERQGTALELLLDNARLRQGCTEAECLAAHYHQECRSLLNGEAEYAEALSRCVGALQRLRPILTQLLYSTGNSSGRRGYPTTVSVDASSAAAALEVADTALLFALLPTASTAQRMQMFEAALRATTAAAPLPSTPHELLQEGQASPSLGFTHPPLAPSPTNHSGSGSGSPTRGGRSGSTPQSNKLAEQFRDLVATAELMHLTGDGAAGGPRTRHEQVPVSTAPSKAFGRTVSLTGLTATKSAAKNKKNKKPTSVSTTLSPWKQSSSAVHSASATGTKKRTTPASGVAAARPLQRSVSAPLPFSRSASARATPGICSSGSGSGGGSEGVGAQGSPGRKPKAAGGGGYNSPARPARPMITCNSATPEKTPSKSSKCLPKSSHHPHLSPKAMWSVGGTNHGTSSTRAKESSSRNNGGAAGAVTGGAFVRSNTVKMFSSPKKSRDNGAATGGRPLPRQRLTDDSTTTRTSAEDTPNRTGGGSTPSSTRRAHKKTVPLSVTGKRGGPAAVGGRCNTVAGAASSPQQGMYRRGLAVDAESKRGVPRKLMRSQTSIAIAMSAPCAASSTVDQYAPLINCVDSRYNRLDYTGTTVSPLVSSRSSSASSLGGDVDDAGRLRGLRARTNGGVGAGCCASVKERRFATTNAAPTTTVSSMASSLDSIGQLPRHHHHQSQQQYLQGDQAKLTMARLLERSATVPTLPHYSVGSPFYTDDGSGVNFNKENQQRCAAPSRQRNSLPDDLTVSRSTLFSDSPLASRDLAASENYY